jgi:hypothetical protein
VSSKFIQKQLQMMRVTFTPCPFLLSIQIGADCCGILPFACYVACWRHRPDFSFFEAIMDWLPGSGSPFSPPSKWPSSCVIYDIQYRKRPAASGGLTYHGTESAFFALSQISNIWNGLCGLTIYMPRYPLLILWISCKAIMFRFSRKVCVGSILV